MNTGAMEKGKIWLGEGSEVWIKGELRFLTEEELRKNRIQRSIKEQVDGFISTCNAEKVADNKGSYRDFLGEQKREYIRRMSEAKVALEGGSMAAVVPFFSAQKILDYICGEIEQRDGVEVSPKQEAESGAWSIPEELTSPQAEELLKKLEREIKVRGKGFVKVIDRSTTPWTFASIGTARGVAEFFIVDLLNCSRADAIRLIAQVSRYKEKDISGTGGAMWQVELLYREYKEGKL